MPLPQTVINQLNNEPAETPGWFWGIINLSIIILVLTIGVYATILFAYEPYLNSRTSSVQSQITTLSQSISSGDEAQLLTYNSQISNLQTLLANHVFFSHFLSWLEQNTESNVTYTQLSFSSASGDEVTISATAASEADVNQQIAIFQSSPEVESMSVSNLGSSAANGSWQFGMSLILNPDIFLASPASASSLSPTTTTNP